MFTLNACIPLHDQHLSNNEFARAYDVGPPLSPADLALIKKNGSNQTLDIEVGYDFDGNMSLTFRPTERAAESPASETFTEATRSGPHAPLFTVFLQGEELDLLITALSAVRDMRDLDERPSPRR